MLRSIMESCARAFYRLAEQLINRVLWPVVTVIPAVPFLFKRNIISEYISMSASARQTSFDTILVTLALDFLIKPYHTLRSVRKLLAKSLDRPAPGGRHLRLV